MNKNIIFLFAALLLTSCQTAKIKQWTADDLVIADTANLAFPKEISPQQAQEDIDFLIFALSKGYGGRKYVPGDSFSQALTAFKNIPTNTNLIQFHDQIDEALYLIPDNHLKAFYKGNVSQKRQSQEKKGHVGKNDIKNPEKIWDLRIDKIKNKRILYVSIAEFPDSSLDLWKGFIEGVESKLKQSDAIVIDLRGNQGGDDTKGMELVTLLFGHDIEHPIKHQYISQTPETFALQLNDIKVDIINRNLRDLKIPSHMTENLENAKKTYKSALNGNFSTEQVRLKKGLGNQTRAISEYKKPIYILMDGSCASSCEFTIAAIELHPFAKKVGENTSGTFHFSNAGLAVLPHSKIKVRIPTQYNEYFDQRFLERSGLTPDIQVPPGEDAYMAVKRMIGPK